MLPQCDILWKYCMSKKYFIHFFIVTYYMKWVTTSWTHSILELQQTWKVSCSIIENVKENVSAILQEQWSTRCLSNILIGKSFIFRALFAVLKKSWIWSIWVVLHIYIQWVIVHHIRKPCSACTLHRTGSLRNGVLSRKIIIISCCVEI